MHRLRLDLAPVPGGSGCSFDVPDIVTALVVADINLERGIARIHDGCRLVATLEKQGRAAAPFWRVG